MSARTARLTALARVARLTGARRRQWDARVAMVVAAIETDGNGSAARTGLGGLASELERGGVRETWLALAVLGGALPGSELVVRVRRRLELDGGWAAINEILAARAKIRHQGTVEVSLAHHLALIDVSGLVDGSIRLVGRGAAIATVRQWSQRPEARLVVWTSRGDNLRPITAAEAAHLDVDAPVGRADEILVPWQSSYLLAGIVDDPDRADRAIALGVYSGNGGGTLGFGLDPVLNAEDEAYYNGPRRYAWHLAVARSLPRLVAGSTRAGLEYQGWKRMLPAVGLDGPDIRVVAFPLRELRSSPDWAAATDTAWIHLIG
ncbi:MAG TPA: hypothetical protein VGM94_11725 [Galbitalea sp.]|jgi:hypothetical protein